MPYTNFNSGGIQPSDSIDITGTWTIITPTGAAQIANKGYVDAAISAGVAVDNSTIYIDGSSKIAIKPLGITDGLISNAASIIYSWDAARPYTVGQVAMSSNSLWLCRVAGTNLSPSLATNNWRQLANIDSAQNLTFTPVVTTTATILRSQTSIMAKFTTADYTVTLPTIASLVGALGDTNSRVQEFKIFKKGQTNKLTIQCGGTDTYADGTTSIIVTAGGTLTRLFASFSETQWFRG